MLCCSTDYPFSHPVPGYLQLPAFARSSGSSAFLWFIQGKRQRYKTSRLRFISLPVLLEVLHFYGSSRGKGKDIKRKRDVFLASKTAQLNLAVVLIGQGEVRGLIADFERGCRGTFFLVFIVLWLELITGLRNSKGKHQ